MRSTCPANSSSNDPRTYLLSPQMSLLRHPSGHQSANSEPSRSRPWLPIEREVSLTAFDGLERERDALDLGGFAGPDEFDPVVVGVLCAHGRQSTRGCRKVEREGGSLRVPPPACAGGDFGLGGGCDRGCWAGSYSVWVRSVGVDAVGRGLRILGYDFFLGAVGVYSGGSLADWVVGVGWVVGGGGGGGLGWRCWAGSGRGSLRGTASVTWFL